MRLVILSGGIGAGKSAAMLFLKQRLSGHLVWFSADECIKESYAHRTCRHALIDAFSDKMEPDVRKVASSDESGDYLKAWLRENALHVRTQRKKLEAILHPHVVRAIEEIRQNGEGNLLVAEVPLHYEIGEVILADLVIVVAASRSVQVRRMMENRGLDEATTLAFLNAQWPIKAKVEKADVVIWNDGDPSALECQTLLLANLLNLE